MLDSRFDDMHFRSMDFRRMCDRIVHNANVFKRMKTKCCCRRDCN